MADTPDTRLRQIDVLRGLAALTVVFSHYFPHWDRFAYDIRVLVPNIAGYYAVKLFFVISGFVIFMTLQRCRTTVDFAVLRFSRLYPAYWASLAVVTALSVLIGGQVFWASGFLANLTMLQEFLGYAHFDNVYWSLSVELAFYLNVALLFALGLHRRIHLIVLAWLGIAALWVVAAHSIGAVTARDVVANSQRDWFALLFALDYAPYFAMGILFHAARRDGWTPTGGALLLAAVAVEFLLSAWEGVIVATVIAIVFGLAAGGRLRFLTGSVTLWLGAISYSLYLAHRNLGNQLLDWLHAHGIGAGLAIVAATAWSLALATVLAYGVERPASAAIRSWYQAAQMRRRVRPA